MEHGQHPVTGLDHPERVALLGPGRVLRVEIGDVGDHPDAAWRIDLTGRRPAVPARCSTSGSLPAPSLDPSARIDDSSGAGYWLVTRHFCGVTSQ